MINLSTNANIKLFKHQKKVCEIESKYFNTLFPKINWHLFNSIKNKITKYKLIINLIYFNNNFYYDLKEIQLDFTREPIEFDYLETIWMTEHFDYIEEIKIINIDIINIIKFALKYNFISYIQYKFLKKTSKKIYIIFEFDKCFEKLYSNEKSIYSIIKIDEIELFFDILEIITLKISSFEKSLKKDKYYDLSNISCNSKYKNFIKKIKFNLDKNN